MNDSTVDSSNAMRAADAVAPKQAYPPEERLPATDIKPLGTLEVSLSQEMRAEDSNHP
jgi:hypothetical protein